MNSPTKNNQYLRRRIDLFLIEWSQSTDRKPLLLRGARQVGKSSAVRNLGKNFFNLIEINFEIDKQAHKVFSTFSDPNEVLEHLMVLYKEKIIPGQTLLFLDEIQNCIPAISMLRYFYEKKPELHVVAAGSLLEFALAEIPSFGVGRIRSLFMYPFSMEEFLWALGESSLLDQIEKSDFNSPLDPVFHERLISYFKKFLILGGMPEVIGKYVNGSSLLEIQTVLDDLILAYRTDFAKYKKRVPSTRIREVFDSVAKQMGGKFVFVKAAEGLKNIQVKEALDLLIMAGLVYPVVHSSANGIPIGAELNHKKQKMLLLDTGIYQRILGLNISEVLLSEDFNTLNKGSIAELFVGLEWLKSGNPYQQIGLYFWSRESGKGGAEVDYVIQEGSEIVPIEVKSSGSGSMQSLHLFMNEKKCPKGLRVSLENFGKVGKIEIIPLYSFGSWAGKPKNIR